VLLLTAGTASAGGAGSTAASGYGGPGNVQEQVGAAGEARGLPFTGLNLTLIALGGTTLVLVGLLVRRRGSEQG
jgi:hypothetical protein